MCRKISLNFPRSPVRDKRGLTFFEIMVTVVILSIGTVMIFRSFLICLDYLQHLKNRLYANVLMNNKITLIQQKYLLTGRVVSEETLWEKELSSQVDFPFKFSVNTYSFEELNGLYQFNMVLSWDEKGRTKSIVRTVYLSPIKMEI